MKETLELLSSATVGRGSNYSKILVKDANLNLHPGSITRLIGANGVGKSTLIEASLKLIPLLKGVSGISASPGSREYQHQIGYLPSKVDGYPNLTLRQWFLLLNRSREDGKAEKIWEKLGGRGSMNSTLSSLSSGNRKKALFLSVVNRQRRIIVLDEPFEEVDLFGQEQMAREILTQANRGAAILLVSHRSVSHLLNVDREYLIENKSLVEFN